MRVNLVLTGGARVSLQSCLSFPNTSIESENVLEAYNPSILSTIPLTSATGSDFSPTLTGAQVFSRTIQIVASNESGSVDSQQSGALWENGSELGRLGWRNLGGGEDSIVLPLIGGYRGPINLIDDQGKAEPVANNYAINTLNGESGLGISPARQVDSVSLGALPSNLDILSATPTPDLSGGSVAWQTLPALEGDPLSARLTLLDQGAQRNASIEVFLAGLLAAGGLALCARIGRRVLG